MTAASLVVRTAQGALSGQRSGGVDRWASVPYAAPPVGDLRLLPPQPVRRWSGIRDVSGGAPAAIQPPVLRDLPTSEDCLHLSVTAPSRRASALPVVVWLHGGGFRIGSGDADLGAGRVLLADDVVVVGVNYRLGALGFLYLPDTAANNGILDQVAALQWVHDNIAAFGGDPENITVVGASAGAKSLAMLLSLPSTAALIRRSVSMSGGADFTSGVDEAGELTTRFARALDLDRPDLRTLQSLPAAAILAAQESLAHGVASTWTWRPTADGVSLPADPLAAIAGGSAAGIALVAGTVADEATAFTARHPDLVATVPAVARRIFGDRHHDLLDGYGDPERFLTEERYRVPMTRLLEAQQPHAVVRAYRFDAYAVGSLPRGHGADTAVLWGGADGLTRDGRELSTAVQAAWAGFARDGIPSAPEWPTWPPYDLRARATLLIDRPARVVLDPDGARRVQWDGVTWRPGDWGG